MLFVGKCPYTSWLEVNEYVQHLCPDKMGKYFVDIRISSYIWSPLDYTVAYDSSHRAGCSPLEQRYQVYYVILGGHKDYSTFELWYHVTGTSWKRIYHIACEISITKDKSWEKRSHAIIISETPQLCSALHSNYRCSTETERDFQNQLVVRSKFIVSLVEQYESRVPLYR